MDARANALKQVCEALRGAGIPYAVVGSLASSARGIPRSTVDVDLVAAVRVKDAQRFAAVLGLDWYADPEQMTGAVSAGRVFNIIYQPSFLKFDIFPATEEFHHVQLERAIETDLPFFGESVLCPVATAEDILLAKLRWYREDGQVSERQWMDIRGILAISLELDFAYVNGWAARLGVCDLLARALEERGNA
jgi:hypothetical protein